MDPKIIAERQAKEEKQAADKLAATRHQQSLDKIDALGRSNLQIMHAFVAYLNKHTSKVEITNQLQKIATPDALKVVAIIKKLDKTVQDKNIDWEPMQQALKPLGDALQQMADKADPEAIEVPEIDYQKMTDLFSGAIEKLAAPVVNVAAPVIKVPKADAPIINTEKVDLAPFVNEVLQVLTDFRVWTQDQVVEPPMTAEQAVELIDLIKKQNDSWAKLLKKNFGGGGGGGGGGYVFKESASLGRASPLVAPELTAAGAIPVDIGGSLSVTFGIIDNEVLAGTKDGVNTAFTTFYDYKASTPKIYLNGVRQREGFGFDYIEAGGNDMTFATAPLISDTIIVDYIKL